jgi:hypothetical protein
MTVVSLTGSAFSTVEIRTSSSPREASQIGSVVQSAVLSRAFHGRSSQLLRAGVILMRPDQYVSAVAVLDPKPMF